MILADSSVWIDHFRRSDAKFADLLAADQIAMHPMVLGELALGTLPNRVKVLLQLGLLPQVMAAQDVEVQALIEQRRLHGRGIGYVVASVMWTHTYLRLHSSPWALSFGHVIAGCESLRQSAVCLHR